MPQHTPSEKRKNRMRLQAAQRNPGEPAEKANQFKALLKPKKKGRRGQRKR